MKRIAFWIIVIVMGLSNFYSLYAVTGWENDVFLSDKDLQNEYPHFSIHDNLFLVVWVQQKNDKTDVYYTSSQDQGQNWEEPVLVTSLPKKIIKPSIILYEGQIIIGLSNETNDLDIFFRPQGSKVPFQKVTVVRSKEISLLPHFIIFQNELWLFYQENQQEKQFKINYIKTSGDIKHWENPVQVIDYQKTVIGSFFPRIKSHGNRLYFLWNDRLGKENFRNDIVLMKIYLKSGYWSDTFTLSDEQEYASFPDFIIKGDTLFLSYFSKRFKEIEYFFSLKNRTFLLEDTSLTLIKEGEVTFPFSDYYLNTLFHHKGKFHLFWYGYEGKKAQLFYSTSTNFVNWINPRSITDKGEKNWNFNVYPVGEKITLVYQKNDRKRSGIVFLETDMKCNAPVVFSPTHKTNVYSYENEAIFKWNIPEDASGIRSLAYAFDSNPDTEPEIENLSATVKERQFKDLENGIYYFHLRAIDNSFNWSPAFHYRIMVDTNPPGAPLVFSPTHQEMVPSDDFSPVFTWQLKEKRPIKGYSYLFTQEKDSIPQDSITTTKTNITFKDIDPGIWHFKIKAQDTAGRWGDYSTFTIIVEDIIIATGFQKEVYSMYFYTIQGGEVLHKIIRDLLQIKDGEDPRFYERAIMNFNHIQNLDFLKPNDKLMFPIIIASPGDTKESISKKVFGHKKYIDRVVIIDKATDRIEPGDKIILKDKYFLETGQVKRRTRRDLFQVDNVK
ncbi:MAG: hypothetical protein JW827_02105 [Spirochaetes bacterium]|nr:hypothetical protein [Spirochaetota bacterium]